MRSRTMAKARSRVWMSFSRSSRATATRVSGPVPLPAGRVSGKRSGSTPLGIGWILSSSTPSFISQVALNRATGATRSARE